MKKLTALVLALVLVLSLGAVVADDTKTITIGATASPHAEILEFIREDLLALGYEMDLQIVDSYFIANPATSAGEYDANYFQHLPFLSDYNNEAAEDEQLVAAIPVHYEPYGIYAGTKSSLDEIAEGDSIAVTNDPSNETRALLLLRDAGLITLPEGANSDSALTALDIVENPYNLEIVEVNAELIPSMLEDVAFAVINGNFAIAAGFSPAEDALFLEPADGESGVIYTNYVVVKAGNENADFTEALRAALQTEKVREYILNNEAYAGGVIPTF